MLTAQSWPGTAAVGTQKPWAPKEPSVWWGWEALEWEGGTGMGGTVFRSCSAQGLEGHLTISPIPAGSGWHHLWLSEPCQRWAATDAGSAALDLLWGEVSWLQWPSKKKKKIHQAGSAWCKPGPWEGNPCKCTPHQRLLPAPNLWDKTPCLLPSWQLFPDKHSQRQGGGDGMGREGRTSPHCSISRSKAPFYSSLCWPLHVQPYVSHVITKAILTGRIIFIFLIQQPANSLWLGDAKNGSHFLHLAK